MLNFSYEVPYRGFGFTIIGDPGMGNGAKGIGLRVPGFIYHFGEQLLVPAQGDCVDLSTRVNINVHLLHTMLCG